VVIVTAFENRCALRKADAHRGATTRSCRAVEGFTIPEIGLEIAGSGRNLLLPRAASLAAARAARVGGGRDAEAATLGGGRGGREREG